MSVTSVSASNARRLLAYGSLGLPLAFAALPIYVHVPRYYADSVGVPLALLGALLLGARLFDAAPASTPEAMADALLAEWVLLLSGSARLEFDEPARVLELRPGDAVTIPAHERHRVAATAPGQDTVWLAVFYKPQ